MMRKLPRLDLARLSRAGELVCTRGVSLCALVLVLGTGTGGCSRTTAAAGATEPSSSASHSLQSERRLHYLVAAPAVILSDDDGSSVAAPEQGEHFRGWMRKRMNEIGLSVVDDPRQAFDVEVRLAVRTQRVGRLTRGSAAAQIVAGQKPIDQWATDEHVEPTGAFAPALTAELVDKLAQRERLVHYADALYGKRTRPMTESVGRRGIGAEDRGGTPPLEGTNEGPGSSARSPLLGTVVEPPAPSAEAAARARAHVEKGRAYYSQGQVREAYLELEQAFILEQDPALVYELGECARSLGNREDAIGFYRDYLRRAPAGPLATNASAHVEELKAAPPGPAPKSP